MTVRRKVVVVGHGMAGGRFVEELWALDPDGSAITVIGDERHGAYNRVLLSSVLAGSHAPEDVLLRSPEWYAGRGIEVRSGTRVTCLDREAQIVVTDDGAHTPYDSLVLATGSAPLLPPLRGLRRDDGELLEGVFAFRTLDDCAGLLAASREAKRAIVVGGGLLGLEAARGLLSRGLDVEVVHGAPRLMNNQLDDDGAAVLRRVMGTLGVASYLDAQASAVEGDEVVTGLRLADQFTLDCDLVVIACGIVPNTHLAAEAGLAVERGIVVDDSLRSVDDPAILAIGECAQHDGVTYGLVAPAWEQAAVAASTVGHGEPTAAYRGSKLVTRLKAMGVDLAAMGDTHADPHADADGTDAAEVLAFVDPIRGTYKKLVIRDGKLAGAILLGDISTVAEVTLAFDRQTQVPADRLHLLFGAQRGGTTPLDPATLPDDATVCHCNAVPAGQIRACARAGRTSVADVAETTRATTGCGTCRGTVTALLTQAKTPV
jgi:assimilatory nitrate reductase electron transfer subunit